MTSSYPFSLSQNAERMLSLLGSFWSSTFSRLNQVGSLVDAVAARDVQHYLNILDLVASISRFRLPVFHVENWYLLRLRESERNRTERNAVRYGDDNVYGESSGLTYGALRADELFSWPLPSGLVGARTVLNRITQSSVVLTGGVDFAVEGGTINFRDDPFNNPDVLIQDVFQNGVVVDREAALWVWRGEFDWQNVYQQFGYAIGVYAASSEGYKTLVNAVFDGLVEGTSVRCVQQLWSALCAVPVVLSDRETVEQIIVRSDSQSVVTNRNVYRFSAADEILVDVGDVLPAGATMSAALRFFEFNRGQLPTELSALAVGPGVLSVGYFGDLVFENKTVPLVVTENVDGYTRVSFEIGGLATDVEKFWDDVHSGGVSSGQTLAMLLDQRDADRRDTQPTAMALPATVNPLGFLTANVLRNNAYAVIVRPHAFGPNALDVNRRDVQRKLVPPHTLGLVITELAGLRDAVIMDGAGSSDEPGYRETVTLTPMLRAPDTLSGVGDVSERVRLRQITGKCQ